MIGMGSIVTKEGVLQSLEQNREVQVPFFVAVKLKIMIKKSRYFIVKLTGSSDLIKIN